MALPTFQKFLQPVLYVMCEKNVPVRKKDIFDDVAEEMNISPEDRNITIKSGTQSAFENRVYWALIYLQRAELLKRVDRGLYKITKAGIKAIKEKKKINFEFLTKSSSSFREFFIGESGKENKKQDENYDEKNQAFVETIRPDIEDEAEEKIKEKIESSGFAELKHTGHIASILLLIIGLFILISVMYGEWLICLKINDIETCPVPKNTNIFNIAWLLWIPVSLLMWNLSSILKIIKTDFFDKSKLRKD